MTDGGSLDHRAEDMSDEQLMEALGAGLRAADHVPSEIVAAAKASYTWLDIDAELAALTFDSITESPEMAGVRSGASGPRALTFEHGDVVVDVEIDQDGTVVGQVAPAPVEWVEVHQAAPSQPVRIAADERGRFRAPGVGHGPFRLLCRFGAGAPFPLLLTDWVTL
jgi:hypothetical protein